MSAKADAIEAVGGLSSPGKMPCFGWSIPAEACITGSKLRSQPGSVCSKCYARKGRYVFPNVKAALQRRLDSYWADPAGWVDAMAQALEGETHFRWFDSGDLQSVEMLEDIVRVARLRPEVKFWLPTREWGMVSDFLWKKGSLPSNLTVRFSMPMINSPLPSPVGEICFAGVSTLSGVTCPAPQQGGKCLDCRKCWSRENVVYAAH